MAPIATFVLAGLVLFMELFLPSGPAVSWVIALILTVLGAHFILGILGFIFFRDATIEACVYLPGPNGILGWRSLIALAAWLPFFFFFVVQDYWSGIFAAVSYCVYLWALYFIVADVNRIREEEEI